ncbi:MAG TPA: VOC family protein [Microvirga sp.]|nr:VOC family protein [Microvirga sp.]
MSPRVPAVLFAALAFLPLSARCLEDGGRPGAPELSALRVAAPFVLARDVDAAARWYEEHLGFERVGERVDGPARSLILSRGMALLQVRPKAVETTGAVEPAPRPGGTGPTVLVDDVDAAVAALEDAGVEILSWPEDGPDGRDRVARIRDPDGNRIQLREPLPAGS